MSVPHIGSRGHSYRVSVRQRGLILPYPWSASVVGTLTGHRRRSSVSWRRALPFSRGDPLTPPFAHGEVRRPLVSRGEPSHTEHVEVVPGTLFCPKLGRENVEHTYSPSGYLFIRLGTTVKSIIDLETSFSSDSPPLLPVLVASVVRSLPGSAPDPLSVTVHILQFFTLLVKMYDPSIIKVEGG